MTQYFWVAGAGTFSSASNSAHFSLSSGGAPVAAVVLTNADDVVFDANSGSGTVTIGTTTVRSIDASAAAAGIVFAGAGTITMSGSTSNGLGFCLKWGGAGAHTYSGIINYTNTVVATLDAIFAVTYAGTFRTNAANADIRVNQTGGNGLGTLAFTTGKLTILSDVTVNTSLTTVAGAKVWVMTASIIVKGTTTFTGASTSSSGTGLIKLRSALTNANFDGLAGAGFPGVQWEPCDNQIATFSGWSATGVFGAFSIDASVQSGVKTATLDFGGLVQGAGSFASFTTSINSGQRIQIVNTFGTLKVTTVTMSNITFIGTQTLAGAGTWSGTNIGQLGTVTGLTASVGATQFRVNNTGAGNFYNGIDSNKWASSSGGTGGTGRAPLPQDNAVVDGNSGTGTLTINAQFPCTDLTVTGGPTVGCGTLWAGYSGTISAAAGVVSPAGNISFTVNADQGGRIGCGGGKTIKMPLGPFLYPQGGATACTLSGDSQFCGVYTGAGALSMGGFAMTLDGTGTYGANLIAGTGAVGFQTMTVNGVLTLLTPVTAYVSPAAIGTPAINVTGGSIVLQGGMGTVANFPSTTVTFTALSLNLKGDAAVLIQYVLAASCANLTALNLDKRARATLTAGTAYTIGTLTVTNASSSAPSKIDSTSAGTKVVVSYGSQVIVDNVDVVDNDADTTIPAYTRNGTLSNTADWNLMLTRVTADNAPATDATARVAILPRTTTDTAPAVDVASRAAGSFSRGAADVAPAVDVAAQTVGQSRSTADSAPALDDATRHVNLGRDTADTAPATDVAVASVTVHISRATADSAPATDVTTRLVVLIRSTTDDAPATDIAHGHVTSTPFPGCAVITLSAPSATITFRAPAALVTFEEC